MWCSLCAHIEETTPDIFYGNISQLWVDRSDVFWVGVLEFRTSEPPGKRLCGNLVLELVEGAGNEVVWLSRRDLEHFWRSGWDWKRNKVGREGDWGTLTTERLENINTWMRTKGRHGE